MTDTTVPTITPLELNDHQRAIIERALARLRIIEDDKVNMGDWFNWGYDENGNRDYRPQATWSCGYAACLAGTIALVELPDLWEHLDYTGLVDLNAPDIPESWNVARVEGYETNRINLGHIVMALLTEQPLDWWGGADPLYSMFFMARWPAHLRDLAIKIGDRKAAILLLELLLAGKIGANLDNLGDLDLILLD